jgi:hypothetical protein
MGVIQNAYKILVRRSEENNQLDYLSIDGRILEWIFEKQGGKLWTGCIWLRARASGRILCTWQ